jgi:hypothetical protein
VSLCSVLGATLSRAESQTKALAKFLATLPGQFEFEMLFRSVRVQRLPRFAIDRHAAEVPFL